MTEVVITGQSSFGGVSRSLSPNWTFGSELLEAMRDKIGGSCIFALGGAADPSAGIDWTSVSGEEVVSKCDSLS
jgi:hypothetical protein